VVGKPVELTFQFDSVRNFSAMVLHTNNMFSKGVQVSCRQSFIPLAASRFGEKLISEVATAPNSLQKHAALNY
jgi:discoidin domain receptor family member 2